MTLRQHQAVPLQIRSWDRVAMEMEAVNHSQNVNMTESSISLGLSKQFFHLAMCLSPSTSLLARGQRG